MKLLKQSILFALLLSGLAFTMNASAMTFMDGKPASIEKITGLGKWTAINIWSANCHICQRTASHMVDIDTALPNVDAYGISIDDVEGKAAAQRFIQQQGWEFPNLLSNASEVDAYIYKNAQETFIGTPTMLLFSPKGKLVAVQPGPVTATDLGNFIKAN